VEKSINKIKMDNDIMKSLGDIDVIIAEGEFLKQNTSVQEQILSLYFGWDFKKYEMEYMLTILETYKSQ
jgi:hypothetical protein|tara:strand:- start:382 stop:588 length:207 start_codon:yes stop_codon:yes gene_type:complete